MSLHWATMSDMEKFIYKFHILMLNFIMYWTNYTCIVYTVYLPPHSALKIVEAHISTIELMLSTHKLSSIILYIPNIHWSFNGLRFFVSGDLPPISLTIAKKFSYFNFFQLNSLSNIHGSIFDPIFSNSNKLSVYPDSYHSLLHIKFPPQAYSDVKSTHRYYNKYHVFSPDFR